MARVDEVSALGLSEETVTKVSNGELLSAFYEPALVKLQLSN